MAAIGARLLRCYGRVVTWFAAVFVCLVLAWPSKADRAADALAIVNHVATGLTNGSPTDALEPFSKVWPDYVRLSDFFSGLTNRGDLVNEVSVVDEEDTDRETKLTVEWTLTIGSREDSSRVESRMQRVKIRIVQQDNKWQIVDMSPIGLFDPQPAPTSK